ncbi:MAG: hypothetical protein ABR543_14930 [Gemmatimonadaceae bacterium]
MQLKVRTKVVAGLIAILGVGTAAMFIIYFGLATLRDGMREFADVREPRSAAAYEMEINTIGIALGVLKYLESADSQYRVLVLDDQSDFERYHSRYMQLSGPGEQMAWGDSIGAAVRAQLATLQQDGVVEQRGVQRGTSKPARDLWRNCCSRTAAIAGVRPNPYATPSRSGRAHAAQGV